jgi:hypothetical protein
MSAEITFYNNRLINNTSTVALTNEDADYPAENAYDNYPSVEARTTVITECTYTVDFGSAKDVEGFLIFNSSMKAANKTTYKVESSDDNFASTEETADLVEKVRTLNGVTRYDWYYDVPGAAWNRRYYRIRMQASAGTYMSLGMFFIADDVYTAVKSSGLFSVDRIVKKRDNENERTGHISREVTGRLYSYSAPYRGISATQRDIFMDIAESGYVGFFPDGTADDVYFGLCDFEQFGMMTSDSTRVYTGSLQFTEVFR